MKQLLNTYLRPFGYELRQFEPTVMSFLRSRNTDLVFDVGANEGQFGLALRRAGYRGRIVSFEPIRTVFDVLKRTADQDGSWEAHPVALGEQAGKSIINVSEGHDFSSILPQRSSATAFDKRAATERTEEIDIATLDQFADVGKGRNCFLKIDTQGYERQVLLGARGTLPMLQGVQMELPIIQLYSGAWGIPEAVSFMYEQGFAISQFHQVNSHELDPVSWVETDCVFRRRDPRID